MVDPSKRYWSILAKRRRAEWGSQSWQQPAFSGTTRPEAATH
jgi:hypothetical protein